MQATRPPPRVNARRAERTASSCAGSSRRDAGEHHGLRAGLPQELDVPQLGARVALGARHGDQQPAVGGGVDDTRGDRREVRVGDVVHHQPERGRGAAGHGLGLGVRRVVQLGGGRPHAVAQRLADLAAGAAVERAGGRGQRDARAARDVGERGGRGRLVGAHPAMLALSRCHVLTPLALSLKLESAYR